MTGARAEVLSNVLGSDVNRLTDLFLAVCEANRRYRDFTRHELHHALREVAAALPVYRTYLRARDRYRPARDLELIDAAVATATERRADLDPDLFAFLGRILRLDEPGRLAGELAMRFQQLTPAAMAKGVEDTAFYRHHRLIALNEVGGDPGHFGTSVPAFHEAMASLQAHWPNAMLALSTHDTKRSADVRARLALLAVAPAGRVDGVTRLEAAAAPHRAGPDLPADADCYLFFQAVVGAWPIDAERAATYLAKATHEAKLRTSWTDPDPEYDAAVDRFVRGALGEPAFVDAVEDVVAALVPASRRAALVQVALELTAPGVPDSYQGSELWELALVDPDNRRPVDFDERSRTLADVETCSATDAWARADDGLPKLWLLHRLLDLRRRRPEAFDGDYRPLPVADGTLGFSRGDAVVVLAGIWPPVAGSVVELPAGQWRDLDGRTWTAAVPVAELLAPLGVSVLERAS